MLCIALQLKCYIIIPSVLWIPSCYDGEPIEFAGATFNFIEFLITSWVNKKQDTILLHVTSLTDFQNSSTVRLISKFATKSYLNMPPHLKHVATLPSEISVFKKLLGSWSSWSKLPCKTQQFKTCRKIFLFCDISIISAWSIYLLISITTLTESKMFTAAVLKIPRPTAQNCCNKEKDATAKCRTWSTVSQTLTASVSQSLSQKFATAVWYLMTIKSW